MDLSVIIPIFNEEANIAILYTRINKVLEPMNITYELIFVNDGSKDTSIQLIEALSLNNPQVKYIDFSRNFGHQIAVTAGLEHSIGKRIVIIDADLQDPPELILDLYKKMDEDFLDISILMYEKYHNTNALSNIYYAYIYKYNPNIPFFNGNKAEVFKNVPNKEQEIALKYLEIGVEKEDYACIESLSEYYLSIEKIDKSEELLKLQKDLIENHKKKVNDSLSKIKDVEN